jgi:hypothetical protein
MPFEMHRTDLSHYSLSGDIFVKKSSMLGKIKIPPSIDDQAFTKENK